MNDSHRSVSAWAPVGKKSGKVLRNLDGRYAIYTHREDAVMDCPTDGEVRGVSIRVLPKAKTMRGILK